MIIEMQKFFLPIVNNSDNFGFLFPLQMFRIEKICIRSHSSHAIAIFILFRERFVVIIPIWLQNRLSVAHQILYFFMNKLNPKLF